MALEVPFTVDDFYAKARAVLVQQPQWRYGQALFNTLSAVRPELAEQVRGTHVDPFYATKRDVIKLDKFGAWVNARWNDQ